MRWRENGETGEEARSAELDERASTLRGRLAALSAEAERWRGERERLNASAKALRGEAQLHRDERDSANRRVAEIKATMASLRGELEERRERLARLGAELDTERRGLPPKRAVERRLRDIDWEIATSPTVELLGREGELSETARGLQKELEEHAKLHSREGEGLMELAEVKARELQLEDLRSEIGRLHEASEESHGKMMLLRGRAEEERRRADEAHAKLMEQVELVRAVRRELGEVLREAQELRRGLRETARLAESERRLVVEAERRRLTEEARRKLEAGERLSLEELKLVYSEEKEE